MNDNPLHNPKVRFELEQFRISQCAYEFLIWTNNLTKKELSQLEAKRAAAKDQLIKRVDFLQEEALQQNKSNGYIKYTDQDPPRYEYCKGLSCQLLQGDPKSGLSTVAAQIAQGSDFPYINIIKPADLLGKDEAETCQHIGNIFKDARVSKQSFVILDDVERLIRYGAERKLYSRVILQKLKNVLRTQPPKGHYLHIICTSNRRDVLEELGLLPVFTSERHVPNLSTPEHIMAVMEASKRFEPEELRQIEAAMKGRNISMGIKRLLELIAFVNPLTPDRRVAKFLEKMGEAMGWEDLRA